MKSPTLAIRYILVFLWSSILYSQNNDVVLDSINALIDEGNSCLKSNTENCEVLFTKTISYANSTSNDSLIGYAYKKISNGLFQFGNIEACIQYANKGLTYVNRNSEYPDLRSYFHKRLATAYTRIQEFDSVYPNFEKAILYAVEAGDFNRAADNHILMASAYNREGKIKLAIKTLNKARPLVAKCTNQLPKIGMVFVLGNIYMNNKQHELAIEQFNEARTLLKDVDTYNYNLATINYCKLNNDLNNPEPAIQFLPVVIETLGEDWNAQYARYNLGHAYHLAGEYDKSIAMANENIEIAKTRNDLTLLSLNYKLLSRDYLHYENGEKALFYASQAVNCESTKKNLDDLVVEAFKLQADAYKINNNKPKALETLETYIKLNDSLNNINNKKELFDLQTYYETEQKKDKIKLQEEEINSLNSKAENDKLTKTLYAIGIISLLAVLGLLYFGFKQRLKKNKIEREKQEEIYKQEIEFKKKELASQTLHLVQKNTFIQELKENLEKIKKSPELFKVEFRRLVMLLKKESAEDKDWEVFKSYFSEVHNNFDHKIKAIAEDITEKEIRLASFLRMNLSTKEIASMLNVLPDSVLKSKYRLKKKLQLDKEEDLTQFLNTL